jgi:hypothetical protein
MSALVARIHVFMPSKSRDVDGGDKPGHHERQVTARDFWNQSNEGTGGKESAGAGDGAAPDAGCSALGRAIGSGDGAVRGRATGPGTTVAVAVSADPAGRGRGKGVRGGVSAAERDAGGLAARGGGGADLTSGGNAPYLGSSPYGRYGPAP